MAVEERFGVRLPDSDCSRVRTVADLAALVIRRLPLANGGCQTASAFYSLRREMIARTEIHRRAIEPGARWVDLFPNGLGKVWRTLRTHHSQMPRLRLRPEVELLLLLATALVAFAGLVLAIVVWAKYGFALGASVLMLAGGGVGLLTYVSRSAGQRLPSGVETVGDLVRMIAPIGDTASGPGVSLLVQRRVLDEVRRITAAQLGLTVDRVRPETDFVRDLRLG